ncbi:MAG: hypothetical protein EOL87_03230 [Spartobacteria bacterium]|nr:hypothetical protein [Spartobacteria bacterium]
MKYRIKRDCLTFYHCMSRISGQQMLLGDAEKAHMRQLIRRVEGFTGVNVLTYAVMTNHFHVLLEEPERDAVVDDAELERRLACLYREDELAEIHARWALWEAQGAMDALFLDKQRYRGRMHDISEFMKQVKQRFSRWYNRLNGRKGSLWDARFKSVVVEQGTPLRVVSAYIEMNPVRAGMVDEPGTYDFCGLGDAIRGSEMARRGIRRVAESIMADGADWEKVAVCYLERVLMYGDDRLQPERLRVKDEALRGKLARKEQLTDFERLLCRCRYFTDGRVIGYRAFVEEYYCENRAHFGPKRETGARKVKGGWRNIYAVRDLLDWGP